MSATSIRGVFLELRDALSAKGLPAEWVTYGPPPSDAAKVGGTRLYVARDTVQGDQVNPPRSNHQNPRQYAVRAIGIVVRIHAQSTIEGAARYDHEALADQIADLVHVALHKVVGAARTTWRVTRAGIVADQTTDGWNGCVYELRAQIDRGVADVTFTGDAAPEGEFTTARTTRTTTGPGVSTSLPGASTEIS